MMKKIKGKIGNIYKRIQTRWQLREMDDIWNLYGGCCFGLHQPSFYHKHSEDPEAGNIEIAGYTE